MDKEAVAERLQIKNPRAVVSVRASEVTEWLDSQSPEIRGMTYDFLVRRHGHERVEPPLASDIVVSKVLSFLEYCAVQFPDDAPGDLYSQFEVMQEAVTLFHRNELPPMREGVVALLERLLLRGDEQLSYRVVHEAVEHLITKPEFVPWFKGWTAHPVLAQAYEEAFGARGRKPPAD